MKKADWIFVAVAVAVALGVWYFFVRPKVKAAAAGTTKAATNQSHAVGSELGPDATGFTLPEVLTLVPGIGTVDWSL